MHLSDPYIEDYDAAWFYSGVITPSYTKVVVEYNALKIIIICAKLNFYDLNLFDKGSNSNTIIPRIFFTIS